MVRKAPSRSAIAVSSLPAGAPDPVVARIRAAFAQALGQPEVVRALTDLGSEVSPSTPEGYVELFRNEIDLTRRTMATAQLTAL